MILKHFTLAFQWCRWHPVSLLDTWESTIWFHVFIWKLKPKQHQNQQKKNQTKQKLYPVLEIIRFDLLNSNWTNCSVNSGNCPFRELTKSMRKTCFESIVYERVMALCMIIMRVLVAWVVFLKLHSKAVLTV